MRWLSTYSFLGLLLTGSFARDYDAYDYYAVHLSPSVDPEDVSSHLGLDYDGPLGQLDDHHVFRAHTRQPENDRIKRQLSDLASRRRKRDTAALEPHILDHVLFSQKQELHKRFPLVKRELPSEPLTVSVRDHGDDEGNTNGTMILQQIAKSLDITDPIFNEQWHLYNPIQKGHDINVTGVWQSGITGHNSTVCIVDDGLDLDSDDLAANYFAAGSYDFNDKSKDPKPRLSDDRHGTRCAGEVSAVKNDVCGVGVAYDSKIAGVRILSKVISDIDEAEAMNYAYQDTDIYSCSWGPPDDGRSMAAPGVLIKRAMVKGVQKGRGGLGSLYVFAIGNGAANDDNCNFDGYTNSIYSVSVGGIDRQGLRPYYSEACSAQLVVTYSSGSGDAIHTTDVGKSACYSSHGGTSAAGPLVAGIYALVIEANPTLSWRDIQWLTIKTAVFIDQPADWKMNEAVGKNFSHEFGYGKADAWAMVEAAKTWKNVKPQAWFFSPWLTVKQAIPQGRKGLASSFEVMPEMLEKSNFERVEHVTVTMNVEHTRRGDLSVELISPSGMVSHIATTRRGDEASQGYIDWTFMSVAHFGEDGVGTWTVVVKDTNVNDHNGTFVDWHLKLFGECMDPVRATLLPLPNEHDDDHEDHPIPTQTVSASTTSVNVPTHTGKPDGNPDDHQHRPVNSKHKTTAPASSSYSFSSSSTSHSLHSTSNIALPSSFAAPVQEDKATASPSASTSSAPKPTSTSSKSSDLLLPHPFPSFGVSKTTQIWIYGALVLILLFLIALSAWWCAVQRRRRRWMVAAQRGGESAGAFEMVGGGRKEGVDGFDGDDEEGVAMLRHQETDAGLGGGRGGGAASGRRKKRAGELYDAFAEGDSEDEFRDRDGRNLDDDDDGEVFGLGEDSEDEGDELGRREKIGERYRDHDPSREGLDV